MKTNTENVLNYLGCIPLVCTAVGLGEALGATILLIQQATDGKFKLQTKLTKEIEELNRELPKRFSLTKVLDNQKALSARENQCDAICERIETLNDQLLNLQNNQNALQPSSDEYQINLESIQKTQAAIKELREQRSKMHQLSLSSVNEEYAKLEQINIEGKELEGKIRGKQEQLTHLSKEISSIAIHCLKGLVRATWIGGIVLAIYSCQSYR